MNTSIFRRRTEPPNGWLFPLAKRAATDERGTVAIITAFVLVAMMGMLSLVVDIGYAYGQRRMAQNVADSGAVAGTKVIARNLQIAGSQHDADVLKGIRDVARKSSGGFTALSAGAYTDSFTAVYVDITGTPLAGPIVVGSAPGGNIPAAAQGVRLTPAKSFSTFFAGVLGIQALSTSAPATSITQVVTGLGPGLYAPYAIWGGNPGNYCNDAGGNPLYYADGTHVGGCNLFTPTGQSPYLYDYRCNNYQNCNVSNGNPEWQVTSNTFKGYFHASNGFLTVGQANQVDIQGGNGVGTASEPINALHDCYVRRGAPYYCTIALPVIDYAADSGTGISLRVVRFELLSLTNDPSVLPTGTPWQGTVVPGTLVYSDNGQIVTSGSTPVGGQGSLQYVRLLQ